MLKKQQYAIVLMLLLPVSLSVSMDIFASDYQNDPEGTIAFCRGCHDHPEIQPLLNAANNNIHHALQRTRIVRSITSRTEAHVGEQYDCLTCHNVVMSENGTIDIPAERDCMQCHDRNDEYWPAVHHQLANDRGSTCVNCHSLNYDSNGQPVGLIIVPTE